MKKKLLIKKNSKFPSESFHRFSLSISLISAFFHHKADYYFIKFKPKFHCSTTYNKSFARFAKSLLSPFSSSTWA